MTRFRSLMFAGVLVRVLCIAAIAGAAAQSESDSQFSTWQIALLCVVFATDVIVFIGLFREELRDWRSSRRPRGKPVGKGPSALPSG